MGDFFEVHGSGPTVLLCNGFGLTVEVWEEQVEILARDHQVVIWDLPGHGRSTAEDPAAYSAAACIEGMSAILDAVGADRVACAGMSLGGYLSLLFHLTHPARTSALVLVATGPGFRSDDARAQWNDNAERAAQRLEEQGLGALGNGIAAQRSEHRSVEGLVHAARGLVPQADSTVIDSLPLVSVPTLIIVGEQDRAMLGASQYMAKKIAGAQLAVIPDAGHDVQNQQPGAFSRAVADFFRQIDW